MAATLTGRAALEADSSRDEQRRERNRIAARKCRERKRLACHGPGASMPCSWC
jgi:hypothetical protein